MIIMYTILHNRLSRGSRVEVGQVWIWFCWPFFWACSMTCLKFEYLYIYPNVCQREIKITWGLRDSKFFTKALKLFFLSLTHTDRQTEIPAPQSLMEATSVPLHPPTYGNLITILSIDGGGIRGLIPGTILCFLESELQVE